MAHMRFTYQKSDEHPFLSVISFVFGAGYALCMMMALFSFISGSNFLTGNRWLDGFIELTGVCLFLFLQSLANNAMSAPASLQENKTNEPPQLEHPSLSKTDEFTDDTLKESAPKINSNPAPVKHHKIVYCKKCGHQIDSKTKKCSGCGKQYFNFKALFKPYRIILSVSLLLNVCLAIYGYSVLAKYERANERVKLNNEYIYDLEEKINSLENKIEVQQKTINKYSDNSTIERLQWEVDYLKSFCEEYNVPIYTVEYIEYILDGM